MGQTTLVIKETAVFSGAGASIRNFKRELRGGRGRVFREDGQVKAKANREKAARERISLETARGAQLSLIEHSSPRRGDLSGPFKVRFTGFESPLQQN